MDEQQHRSVLSAGTTVLVVGKIGIITRWAGPGLFDEESHYYVNIDGSEKCYPEHLIEVL